MTRIITFMTMILSMVVLVGGISIAEADEARTELAAANQAMTPIATINGLATKRTFGIPHNGVTLAACKPEGARCKNKKDCCEGTCVTWAEGPDAGKSTCAR